MPSPPELILASASPRRRDILAEAGYAFRVVPAEIEETSPAHLTGGEIVLLNATRKANFVAQRHPASLILGVDTLVSLDGEMLGKPADRAEARSMLERLSGRTHEVLSGVWLTLETEGRPAGFVEMSRVRFRRMEGREIERYFDLINPLDKAGGYAAQEDPLQLIEAIEGSRSNVIGLPVERLAETLRAFAITDRSA